MSAAVLLRDRVITGKLKPGDRLNEVALASELDVSRNTLREAFRLLDAEGLVTHEVHRGVQVATLSMARVVDLYRVRRLVEVNSLRDSTLRHPAGKFMRRHVDQAFLAREEGDWQSVAVANLGFHREIVALSDSPRLGALFDTVSVEMQLAFSVIHDLEFLHDPFIELNDQIITTLERGEADRAAGFLESYLLQSERLILGAYVRASRD